MINITHLAGYPFATAYKRLQVLNFGLIMKGRCVSRKLAVIKNMKTFTTFTLILVSILTTKGQSLSAKIVDQPDGLTLGYFNGALDTCLPQLFLGDTLQILFPCYNRGDYQRIDISKATAEIKRLREILTREFLLKLNKCCSDKNCSDTNHGYFLMVKTGDKDDSQYLDVEHISSDKCESDKLQEMVKLLISINNNYR